jgi:phosphoribosylanthranilate isomerase
MSGCWLENGAFPRELPADRVSAIFAALPPEAKRVALSLSPDPAKIARIVEQTRPDIIHIGAAVELFSIRDTQALKAAFPGVRVMGAIPIVDEPSIECAKDYRGVADLLLLDSHDPGDKQIGARGRVHDWNISRRIVDEAGVPAILAGGLDAGNSPRLLPRCGPWVSIRRPKPTGPTATGKISTRCAASSLPPNSPGQGSSPQLDSTIVLYHAQKLPPALRSGCAAEAPVVVRFRGELRIENDRLAAVCRMRQ